jgi:hypothetical protein
VRTLPTGERYEWRLSYSGLSASEMQTLREFHTQMSGAWRSFRFCDPLRNLLAWSEDQTQAAWTKDAGLVVTLFSNPGAQGARLANTWGAEAVISQTVACDPRLPYSMAVTARGASAPSIGLIMGGQRQKAVLAGHWNQYVFSATPGGAMDEVVFAVAVPAGATAEIAGVMVECGTARPEYRRSDARGGLFSRARFLDDALVVSGVEPGVYATTVTIVASAEE